MAAILERHTGYNPWIGEEYKPMVRALNKDAFTYKGQFFVVLSRLLVPVGLDKPEELRVSRSFGLLDNDEPLAAVSGNGVVVRADPFTDANAPDYVVRVSSHLHGWRYPLETRANRLNNPLYDNRGQFRGISIEYLMGDERVWNFVVSEYTAGRPINDFLSLNKVCGYRLSLVD